MRRATILLVVLGAFAFLAARVAVPLVGHAAAAPSVGNASVSGSYAFSTAFHDPLTGQEGNSAGSLVFDGAGGLIGVYSQGSRCTGCGGEANVDRAPITGTYTVYPDGSTTLDICIQVGATPVRVVFQGAFSSKFSHLGFVETTLGTCGGTSGPPPNANAGTADKLWTSAG
ncbi:MAG: hypothetical protein WBB76_11535 [Gaiellaceae bacterium]